MVYLTVKTLVSGEDFPNTTSGDRSPSGGPQWGTPVGDPDPAGHRWPQGGGQHCLGWRSSAVRSGFGPLDGDRGGEMW